MHKVPRTDMPEKKIIWTVYGVLKAGSSGRHTRKLKKNQIVKARDIMALKKISFALKFPHLDPRIEIFFLIFSASLKCFIISGKVI